MSLLTKEQGRKVLEAKMQIKLYRAMFLPDTSVRLRSLLNEVLTIIDDLQSRAPKQYTEQELREWFENRPLSQDEINALLHEVTPGENEAWYSVLKFAAHVGALKAEP